jgi:UDP-GlcNAc3NAcA epimerase
MKKIVTILGARPQFVKAAVLSRIISKHREIEEVIVHTGQHYDANMSAVFFEEMNIPTPAYNLDINGVGRNEMTTKMSQGIETILKKEAPAAVVVYGDTNSTLAGALAAKKRGIKVVHIEAGLRSYNTEMPEEKNRVLVDQMSDLLLCPTDTSLQNLAKEGFSNSTVRIQKCGDIMKDAVLYYSKNSREKSNVLRRWNLQSNNFVVATIHRQENTDNIEKLKQIFEGLSRIHASKKVILPLHPRTKKILEENKLSYPIQTIPPVGYYDMLELLKNCHMVVTDSGGLQKEAYFNGKHCIIAREETEWVELVTQGFAEIVGSDSNKMCQSFTKFKESTADFGLNLYGNDVGESIYKALLNLITQD